VSTDLVVIAKNQCIALKCGAPLADLRLFCTPHWEALPLSLRLKVFDSAFDGPEADQFVRLSREAIDILYDKEKQLR
jgi:hypothetical protein